MSQTGQVIALIVGLSVLGIVVASISHLSASGKEKDPQRAILLAVQSAAGFLMAEVVASIGVAAALFIR